jgi:glycerol-3-phosphate cytidylyltransferase-like family protein
MEIVRAIRYVDEVFEIPIDLSGTRDIYNMYHFDVQFSGSDYAQDSSWLADKRYLESHGAELVFLPYTNGTSSTQIRERLIKG